MNLSALLARQKQHKAQVVVNMLPDLTQLQLIKTLKSRKQNLKNLVASKFFVGWFHKNVGYELLKRANISNEKSVAAFTDADINNLAQVMQNLTFNVVGVYDNNQVYSGGVKLTELDNNLQSLKHKNFYVCGEACNVDGLCGGYNLQWAWTSGKIVGETIAND
jgi:predicted flavoprotein YhiN